MLQFKDIVMPLIEGKVVSRPNVRPKEGRVSYRLFNGNLQVRYIECSSIGDAWINDSFGFTSLDYSCSNWVIES